MMGTMPIEHLARRSRYDQQPLSNPKEQGGGGGGGTPHADASRRLQVNWHWSRVPDIDKEAGGGGRQNQDDPDEKYHTHEGESEKPVYDQVTVSTDDLVQMEQILLGAATGLAARFNALRDRSQAALDDPMWGLGEGSTIRTGQTETFVPSSSVWGTRQFLASLGSQQQSALQNAAHMITLSGTVIELLEKSVIAYAQMDRHSVFPDPATLDQD